MQICGDDERSDPMTSFPPPSTSPAGWYLDPEGSGAQRYFDGYRWHPLGPQSPAVTAVAPGPNFPIRAGVWALVVLVSSLLMSGLAVLVAVAVGVPDPVAMAMALLVAYGPALVYTLRAARRWGTGDVMGDLGLRTRWVDLGWGVVVWIAAVVVQGILAGLILWGNIPMGSNTEGVVEFAERPLEVVVLLFGGVIAAPLVEEVVFRGLLQRALVGAMALVPALGIQAVLFGVLHLNPMLGLGNLGLVLILSAVGVVFGVAAHVIGRVGPVIIAHALFNGVVLVVVLTGVLDDLV